MAAKKGLPFGKKANTDEFPAQKKSTKKVAAKKGSAKETMKGKKK